VGWKQIANIDAAVDFTELPADRCAGRARVRLMGVAGLNVVVEVRRGQKLQTVYDGPIALLPVYLPLEERETIE
jgi:hypothetical protein